MSIEHVEQGTPLHNNLYQILTAGNRATELVKQILAFSRQNKHELKAVQAKLIAKEVIKLLRASLPVMIDVRQNIWSDSLTLADPTHLHQILMNLCTNAGHAMEEKGGVLEVTLFDVELDADFAAMHHDIKPGPYLKLSVSDTGYGIPPDLMNRIFDPFFTTKEPGEGTGMGLSVVHGIVKNYGGTLTLYSEPYEGTTFNVFLPILVRVEGEEIDIEKPLQMGNEHILFVDDEEPLADMGRQVLESLGYEVTTRTSSIEALELFKAHSQKFNMVITDFSMPNMTGEELVKEIIDIRHDIPVILCTGYSARMDDKKAKEMGIRAFVTKPIHKNDLSKIIRDVLDV